MNIVARKFTQACEGPFLINHRYSCNFIPSSFAFEYSTYVIILTAIALLHAFGVIYQMHETIIVALFTHIHKHTYTDILY